VLPERTNSQYRAHVGPLIDLQGLSLTQGSEFKLAVRAFSRMPKGTRLSHGLNRHTTTAEATVSVVGDENSVRGQVTP
jgi:hypothetical protein